MQWVHLYPQGGEKIRRNLQGKFVNAPPAHQVHPSTPSAPWEEQESIFGDIFAVREDLELQLVVSDRLLKATTKKVVYFFEENSALPDQILDTPMFNAQYLSIFMVLSIVLNACLSAIVLMFSYSFSFYLLLLCFETLVTLY